ncbi:MAG: permease [Clostridium sp.]|nr:permease [Clostridium sp.]
MKYLFSPLAVNSDYNCSCWPAPPSPEQSGMLYFIGDERLREALNIFIYNTIKILILIAVIIFIVSIIRSYFPPEKAKKILSNKKEYIGNILASLLGIVTPFCSCSAVPIFIGFIEAGIPLGVTLTFLISSSMVNEVALVLLWGYFGWKIAVIYIVTGTIIATVSGIIIGRLKLESYVEDYVYKIKVGNIDIENITFKRRLKDALDYVKGILQKIWIYIIIGVGVGALIQVYVPVDSFVEYAGKDNPLAVIVAVIIGIPLYSNAAGTIPIVEAFIGKGMAMGTALAFMMSVTALSLPEIVLLRSILKPKLIGIFIGIIAVSIIFTGYLFNIIL